MQYFKTKVKELRTEYKEKDAKAIVRSKGGKCELCGRRTGEVSVFGPTHYVRRRIVFRVKVHIHKIKAGGHISKVVICDSCHLCYHLFARLDPDAVFGDKTIRQVANSKPAVKAAPRKVANRRVISGRMSRARKKHR